TYSWGTPNMTSGVTNGVGASNASSFSGTLTNSGTTVGTATYFVTPNVPGSCISNGFTVTVSVIPVAIANEINLTTCTGVPFSFSPVGTIPSGTAYGWSAPTGGASGGSAASNQSNFNGTLTNTTNAVVTGTYFIRPTSSGCAGPGFTATVSVFPSAAINSISITTCSGVSFTPSLSGRIPDNTSYSWSLPTGTSNLNGLAGATNASSFSGTLTNTSNATRTATYFATPNVTGACTSAVFSVFVTVFPSVSVNNIAFTTCSGIPFAVTPVSGTIPASTTYSWTAPSLSGTVGGTTGSGNGTNIFGNLTNTSSTISTATYTVTPNPGAGCNNGASFTVTITVIPVAIISSTSLTTCSGVLFDFNPTGSPVPVGTSYTWGIPTMTAGVSSGVGASNASSFSGTLNNTNTTVGTATYFVTPNVPGGCTSAGFTVTVSVFPVANISSTSLTTCTGVLFNLNPTGTPVPTGTSFSWSAPTIAGTLNPGVAGSNSNSFSGTLTNMGTSVATATYFVTPNVPGGCTSAGFTVTVNVFPIANASQINLTTCTGLPFSFSPVGTIPSGTAYSWSASTGGASGGSAASNQSNFNGTLTNTTNAVVTGTYFIRPTSSGCAGPGFTATVSVFPSAAINSISITTCSGISFTPSLSGRIPDNTSYTWSLPTGTSNLNGLAGATNASSFSGTLTNTSNATRTATYFVTPNVTGNCTSAVFSVFVTVFPSVSVNDIAFTTCSGVPFAVTPVSGTIPASTTYNWSAPTVSGTVGGATGSSAGATNINGNLTNTSSTISTATYTVTPSPGAGCASGATFTVTVTVLPLARINGITQVICSGQTIDVDPAAGIYSNIVPAGTKYSWTSPVAAPVGSLFSSVAQTNANSIVATLTSTNNSVSTATYTVTPVLANGCLNSSNFTIVVTVNPFAYVNAMTRIFCDGVPFTITPTHNVDGTIAQNTSFSWTVQDS
ncbi:MAG: beta strand repeat-containing protein, partial [Bacteroidota bacterium]